MENVFALILAAGEGKRMKSALPKVLHNVCAQSMLQWVIDSVKGSCGKPVVVVGHGRERIMEQMGQSVDYAVQEQQKGTGHAVMMARKYLSGKQGYVLILAGDMPLIRQETVEELAKVAVEKGCGAVVLSTIMKDPFGYGRIVRNAAGEVTSIVEQRDASEEQRKISEVNSSVYCFEIQSLLDCLSRLGNDNAQGEYYLTDCIAMLAQQGKKVCAIVAGDESECMGVNDRVQLSQADKLMRRRINEAHMRNGVTMLDPDTTYIGPKVKIGRDTVLYPGNVLQGETVIGEGCMLYPNSRIEDSEIGDGASIQCSVITNASVGKKATIGPNVHLRPHAEIGENCRVGNFVEVKNSKVGDGSKISHLTYVGDGEIGKDCNIGCGVVFVNYNGYRKQKAIIGDHVFVGCNTNLVAPVNVGDHSYIAAGSTITDDVPEDALAIARARQVNKENWMRDKLK